MFKSIKSITFHISIITLSAALALSLPYTGKLIADHYLTYWALIEGNKTFLISVEIVLAAALILLLNFLRKSYRDGKLSKMARNDMGLVLAAHTENDRIRKKVKKLKQELGMARDVLMLGSTGYSTFFVPEGDLHEVIMNCREAKIMLLNPGGEGASVRAKSIPDPEVTPELFREQIVKSIDFLKGLKMLQKNIRLKLYQEIPLLKLTILGDYLFMKYYHSSLNERYIPEYIFKHAPSHSSLFHLLYQYFLSKWRDPAIPEYDFDTDELIYRDTCGNEIKREKFHKTIFTAAG